MINDAIVATAETRAVHRLVREIANAKTHIANNHIVRAVSTAGKIGEADAIARRSLPGDGAICIMNRAWRFQFD